MLLVASGTVALPVNGPLTLEKMLQLRTGRNSMLMFL